MKKTLRARNIVILLEDISVELIDFDNHRDEPETVEAHSQRLLAMIKKRHKHIF